MRILAVSTWFPYPPNNGSRQRAYQLLKMLGNRHTVDLLAISQDDGDVEYVPEVRKFCRRVATFPGRSFDPGDGYQWTGLFSKIPRAFIAHHWQEMESLASRWNMEEQYDAALAITLGAAPYIANMNIPKAIDQHNVECRILKRQCEMEASLARRVRATATWLKAESFEREIVSKFDLVTLVSDHEEDLMREVLGRNSVEMEVVPNGVDPQLLEYRSPARVKDSVVFNGAITYYANKDAATRLCTQVLPLIRQEVPEAQLRITGDCGDADISGMSRIPGVEFTGYVDDIHQVVASSSALVVPLRYGGGTRLKILEAMALGTPVVSTPMGAEGLGLVDGKHILLGTSAKELASQTVRLLSDSNLSASIARAAAEKVRESYLWPDIASKFESAMSRVLGRRLVTSGVEGGP